MTFPCYMLAALATLALFLLLLVWFHVFDALFVTVSIAFLVAGAYRFIREVKDAGGGG